MELTSERLDKLLACLSSDREEAGRLYEIARVKLMRRFEWCGARFPDALVDETFDRVARRLDEGVQIDNPISYLHGVAQRVLMEDRKKKYPEPLDEVVKAAPPKVEVDPEPRLECLDDCLASLPTDSRQLIIDYYQEERRAKIELRQQLADKLGIPLNALRIRAHRIRATLEKCVTKCVESIPEAK